MYFNPNNNCTKIFLKPFTFVYILLSLFLFTQKINCISNDNKIQLTMLMNHIQYILLGSIISEDKEFLTEEYDFILNKIDKSKFKIDKNLIEIITNKQDENKVLEAYKELIKL